MSRKEKDQEIINTFVIPRGGRQIIREIIEEEAKKVGLTPFDLVGRSRKPKIVKARQFAMYRAKKETNYSFPRISEIFNRDHTTVLYAFYKIKEKQGE